jgi:SAM-dependent methyltransferase
MQDINPYWKQLSDGEIAAGAHRGFVGGLWEELGRLQLDFLVSQGLQPHHTLVDIGCGALRGGLFFARYLAPGNYYGLDINASLIEAGKMELEKAGLRDRHPHLLVDDKFELSTFGVAFDFALAQSLFTHLCWNHILCCLSHTRQVLGPRGRFYATFFEAPSPVHLEPIMRTPGNMRTHYDRDPYHYAFAEIQVMARMTGWRVELLGEWGHPRSQSMLVFTRQ